MTQIAELHKWREPVWLEIVLFIFAYGSIIISGIIAYKKTTLRGLVVRGR